MCARGRRPCVGMPASRSVAAVRSATGAESGVGDGEDCEVDVLVGTEPDDLVGRRVGSEVVDLPVGIAQGHRGHRRRQGWWSPLIDAMATTPRRRPRGLGRGSPRMRSTIAEARCSVQIGRSPRCHPSPIRRSAGTRTRWSRTMIFVPSATSWLAMCRARGSSPPTSVVVHPLLLASRRLHAGWTSGRGRSQLGLNRREVAPGDAVPATHERTPAGGPCAPIGRRFGSARRAHRQLVEL